MAVLTADIGTHLCRDVGGDELIVFVHVEPIISQCNSSELSHMSGPPLKRQRIPSTEQTSHSSQDLPSLGDNEELLWEISSPTQSQVD